MKFIQSNLILTTISLILIISISSCDSQEDDISANDNNPDSNIPEGIWIKKDSFDYAGQARSKMIHFVINNKFYLGLGENIGISDEGLVLDFWGYDVAGNSWVQKSNFPGTGEDYRYNAQDFVIGSKAYIVSAGKFPGGRNKEVWSYNTDTDTWTAQNEFSGEARQDGIGVSVGDKGYVGLGNAWCNFSPTCLLNDLWEYNPDLDSWTKKTDFPGQARESAAYFTIGNNIYVVGGYGKTSLNERIALNDCWQYNTESDIWTQLNDLPLEIQNMSSYLYDETLVVNDRAYTIIWSNQNNTTLWQYSSESDVWTKESELDFDISHRSSFAFTKNGIIYYGDSGELWLYKPKTD